MFLKKLIEKIGDFFESLFDNAAKAYNKLSPDVQDALVHGSGIIAVINSNIDKAPVFVIELLQQKWPDLTVDKIKAALAEASKGLDIAGEIEDPDLEMLIINLQKYLSGLSGKVWAKISHTLGLGIAAALAPKETKFAALSSLIDYVYHDLIKGGK